MGGTAPANQLRLSSAGSEDGEAETETCRAAKPLWRTTTRTLRPVRAQLAEPPYADPHVRWCGRGEWATTPPMPILCSAISPSTQFLATGGQHNLSPRTVFHLRKPAAFFLASYWLARLECIQ